MMAMKLHLQMQQTRSHPKQRRESPRYMHAYTTTTKHGYWYNTCKTHMCCLDCHHRSNGGEQGVGGKVQGGGLIHAGHCAYLLDAGSPSAH